MPLLSHSSHCTVYAVPDLSPPSSRHPLPDLPEPVIRARHSYQTARVRKGKWSNKYRRPYSPLQHIIFFIN